MKSRWLIFITVVTGLIIYTGFKVSHFLPSGYNPWLLTDLFFLFMLFPQFVYRSDSFPAESFGSRTLIWAGSVAMGVWATFILFSLSFDLGDLAAYLIERLFLPSGFRLPFSAAAAHWGSAMIFLISAVLASLGLRQAVQGPVVKNVLVDIAGLPKSLQGLKIVQLSDLHVGPTIRRSYVEEVVRKVQEIRPDLIAITGDLADGKIETLEPHLRPLENLTAPLGIFYVTGNHEYYWGAEGWIKKIRDMGFTPLVNENRVLSYAGSKFLIAGVPDTTGHHFVPAHRSDPQKAAESGNGVGFKLLLAHRPESCKDAEKAGFDLQLSGHTHAGQFFPWNLIVALAYRHYQGLKRYGKLWVYINAGTGYWGPPHRFQVPSEITLINLRTLKG